ncbi:MAG: polyprenyl synthetase family protein [Blastocatellia bacterium]|jgi:geranylgeranyl diphosphate synthase type II
MSEKLAAYIETYRGEVEAALTRHLPVSHQERAVALNEALRYSLFPGGKRWRPILALLGAELVGADPRPALPAACAMEYLHTSSIILDDLPAMDDADLRRGRKSLHRVHGESLALLTALALLNQSYGLLVEAALTNGCHEAGLQLVREAVMSIGADGMIGGQVVDLVLQGGGQGGESLASRNLKTTALMRLTLVAGALACGTTPAETAVLARFGEDLGMAYQICDDLLDELAGSEVLGKPARQDARHARSNYLVEFGAEPAHRMAIQLVEAGLASLHQQFGPRPAIGLIEDASRMILGGMGHLASVRG